MQTRRSMLIVCGLALFAVGLAAAQEKKPAAPQDPPKPVGQPVANQPAGGAPATTAKIGEAAPDFTLLDLEGNKHKLADLKDKVVVLQWFNKDCPVVRKALPATKELAKKYEGKIVWLAIDSTPGRTADENAKYVKEQQLSFPILMDAEQKIGRLYGATNTPHMFVINKGTLVYTGALNEDLDKKPTEARQYVDEAITALLAGKAVPVAETKAVGCGIKYQGDKPAPKADAPAGGKKDAGKPDAPAPGKKDAQPEKKDAK